MSFVVVVPLMIAAIALSAAWFIPPITRPATAAWVITASMVLVVAAISAFLVQMSAAGLSEIGPVADLIGWCRALYGGQHGATPWVGLISLAALAIIGLRVVRHLRAMRTDLRHFEGVSGITIVDTTRPIAFAVPGNPGGVVMSRSMLEALEPDERIVVVAHENAHLRFHHHVFVRITGACAAALPILDPIARRVRFLTERWADEFAADRVGSRRLVADTIARVALLPGMAIQSAHLALAGGDVIARIEALDCPAPRSTRRMITLSIIITSAALIAAVAQFQNLVALLDH